MNEMELPVAVVLLGPHGRQRELVTNYLIRQFSDRYKRYVCSAEQDRIQVIRIQPKDCLKIHIFDLDDELGSLASVRRSIVKSLRFGGAETVVGVYAGEPRPSSPDGWSPDLPCAEEFDYFVVIPDDSLPKAQTLTAK